MKKLFAILLLLVVLALAVAACAPKTEPADTAAASGGETVPSVTTGEGTSAEPTVTTEPTAATTMDPADPYVKDALFPSLD